MKNKGYIFLSLSILIIGGFFIFKKYKNNIKISKEEAIMIIVANGFSQNVNNLLSTFEEEFLLAWIEAIKNGENKFTYKNNQYNTQGGSKIK